MNNDEFRSYSDSGLKEGSHPIPVWMIIFHLAIFAAAVSYLIFYR